MNASQPKKEPCCPIELRHDVQSYPVHGWKLRADRTGLKETPADFRVIFHNLASGEEIPCDQSRIETYPEECQRLYEHFIALVYGYGGMRQYLFSHPPVLH